MFPEPAMHDSSHPSTQVAGPAASSDGFFAFGKQILLVRVDQHRSKSQLFLLQQFVQLVAR
jgi:hypothetical protein